jgi:2-oxo-3-hexenedioate decarboxylase
MLDPAAINAIADRLDAAQSRGNAVPMLTTDYPAMTIEDGYAVQELLLNRWQGRGREFFGFKSALTSKARKDQMGVDAPCFGLIMRDSVDPEGGVVSIDKLIAPRVEVDIAFVMKEDLAGPHMTLDQVYAATDYVQPALEITDSRFGKLGFDAASLVADNCSSARLVMGGRPRRPEELDLTALGVVLEINGEPIAFAASGAVLGHPAHVIQRLVSWLHGRGKMLRAGTVVLTGTVTDAHALQSGDAICARFQDMGTINVTIG